MIEEEKKNRKGKGDGERIGKGKIMILGENPKHVQLNFELVVFYM
jgi:hypothetical protein